MTNAPRFVAPPPAVPDVALDNPIPASWEASVENAIAEEAARAAAPARLAPRINTFPDEPLFKQTKVIDVPANRRTGRPAYKECASCGKELAGDTEHMAAARIVRHGQKYGNDEAGSLVWIELKDLHGAAAEATISLEEWRRLVGEREARLAAAPAKEKPQLVRMMEQSFDAAVAQSKALIDAAKERAERAAAAAAAEALAVLGMTAPPAPEIPRSPTPIDQETGSQPTKPVE